MAFSGMVAADGLPAWMYHAQRDNRVFGITWVDLVFPFFLFAMGAAIPIVIERRLAQGQTYRQAILALAGRALLLALYALLGQHWRPYAMAERPHLIHWLLGLFGFVALAILFVRWPNSVSSRVRRTIWVVALLGAIIPLCWVTYPDGVKGIANYRNDSILMVLANVSLSAGLIYLFTRRSITTRIVVMVVVAVIVMAGESGGIAKIIWDWAPTDYLHLGGTKLGRFFPIFYRFYNHKYLLIVLPGSICGEILLAARHAVSGGKIERSALAMLMLGASAVVCVGMLAREIVWSFVFVVGIAAAARYLVKSLEPDGGLLTRLWNHGTALLALGFIAEPLGGGIRKDNPTTLSYYLVTAGLAFYATGAFTLLATDFKQRWWAPVADTGANPILGYLVITNLVPSLCGLVGIEAVYENSSLGPWLVTGVGFAKTIVVVVIVVLATRRGLLLRA